MSTVNETAMTTGYESIMVPPAAVREKLNNSLEELDALSVSDCDGNQFLDGCKVSWVLCCFQTSLPLIALPLWWRFLYNCASATRRRGNTKQWAASSQSIDILVALLTAADSWLLFNLRAMSLGGKGKVAWPLRAATLKLQAVIRRWNSNSVSGRLVWNQL